MHFDKLIRAIKIVELIDRVIVNVENESALEDIANDVNAMMADKPLFVM